MTGRYILLACPVCRAGELELCIAASGHRRVAHAARVAAHTRLNARVPLPRFRLVHCPKCGAAPDQPCVTRSGAALATHHEARRLRLKLVRYVRPEAITTEAMIAGRNERKYSRIISNGNVYRWNGYTWVKIGPPTFDDDPLPRVL